MRSSVMRRLTLAALLSLAAPPVTAAFGNETSPERSTSAWSLGAPIVMYWSQSSTLTYAVAQQAVNGGFNTVWVYGTSFGSSEMASQMITARKHGLRVVLFDPKIISPASLDGGMRQGKLNALIDQYKTFPAAYAYFLDDEPDASKFAGLARLKSYIHARDPNHLAFINLWNCTATSEQFGTSDYAAYFRQYMNTVKPGLLSSDYYQFYKKVPDGTPYDQPEYLKNLGVVSQIAHDAGVPFMNVVQACAWYGNDSWRVPNTNELRYLQYSSLAYGAQAICYFNYSTQHANTGGIQPYPDGSPSPVYTSLVTLKDQFARVASNFTRLHWMGTYLKGYKSGQGPPGTTTLPSNSAFTIANLSDNLSYSVGAMVNGVNVGLFRLTSNGQNDPASATFAMVTVNDYSDGLKTLTIRGPGNLSRFDATSNAWIAAGSNEVTLNLPPGGGVLVGLTSQVPHVVSEPSTRPPG